MGEFKKREENRESEKRREDERLKGKVKMGENEEDKLNQKQEGHIPLKTDINGVNREIVGET